MGKTHAGGGGGGGRLKTLVVMSAVPVRAEKNEPTRRSREIKQEKKSRKKKIWARFGVM